jgi:hypothetical protein
MDTSRFGLSPNFEDHRRPADPLNALMGLTPQQMIQNWQYNNVPAGGPYSADIERAASEDAVPQFGAIQPEQPPFQNALMKLLGGVR